MRKYLIMFSLASLFIMSANAEVYATVDGEEVTDKDMMFLKQAMPNIDFNTLPKDMRDKAIDQAIERKLLTKEANKDKNKIENTKEYKEALDDFKETMVLELWMRGQMDNLKVSESDIKKYYNENKDKMIIPEQANARHILVDSEKEAKDIIKELDKAGKNAESKFIELAKSKSKDPSASNGGDLPPFVKEGQMIPEFSNATFALKPNTYTKNPIKTQYGYHIIYLKSIQPKGVLKYEDIKPKLQEELKLVKFREVIANKAKELKKKSKIEIK
ncbi:DUF1947 domain-containing protein [Helicobacter sp. MIT 14-3879]|uniref:peptidylprolyl isomerase n=1 Tax=Helicobacter sp. MIT 14-3879 TaxID=2040649 RepID=UPI000E1F3572|nr:peptidyl-prolyl cis-trans isomerase [Helicobacter sp. MIT 14-3879]RDU62664.1 peptidylprolyl isomerase [Helicobacter sp. MIT 14-3879]